MDIRTHVKKILGPFHKRYRAQKLERFFRELCPNPEDTLLDVGGGVGIVGEFQPLYRFFKSIQVVNLDSSTVVDDEFRHVAVSNADGCALPYSNHSFDWVFSNAVIEHVGGTSRQKQFASEIRRVARKGYFVATPNRHFPVDPHTLLPFYQYLSPSLQSIAWRLSPGYMRSYEAVDMLSERDLRALFPGAVVQKLGMRLLPNNLIAYRSFASS